MATIKPLVNYSGIIKESQTGDVVGVANGGTGATTLTSHGVLIGNGTSAIAATSAGTSGQVLTSNGASADPTFQTVSGASAPILAYKTADQNLQYATTLTDCTGLSFSIGANETWHFRLEFKGIANGAGGIKWLFTVPSGCTATGITQGKTMANLNSYNVDLTTGGGQTLAIAVTDHFAIMGKVVNSSTAGTVQFQFAQNASSSFYTSIYASAYIIAHKIS